MIYVAKAVKTPGTVGEIEGFESRVRTDFKYRHALETI